MTKKDDDLSRAYAKLGTPSPEFKAFVDSMPAKYWARYDLSAVRLGWEAARAALMLSVLFLFSPLVGAVDTDGDGFSNWYDGDYNNDGAVNFADLATLRAAFGTNNANVDLTGDGLVNFADLARLRALFGKPPGGSALVSWTPPTLNEDGTPLNDLAGYVVYYSVGGPLVLSIETIDATLFIGGLRFGTWDFRVRAFDETGNPSVFSNTASKTIP